MACDGDIEIGSTIWHTTEERWVCGACADHQPRLLRSMDQIGGTHRGLICGCTNVPQLIDGALRSRFDATLEFGLPTPKAIAELVETTVAAIDVDFPSPDPACYGGWCHREIVRDIRHRAKGAMVSVVPTMVAAGRA